MKILILSALVAYFSAQVAYAHKEHTHQYIVREAYKLLRLQVGEIPELSSRIGFDQIGNRPWETGLVVTGAYREDLEDIIYGYSSTNPPTIIGPTSVAAELVAFFGGMSPDPFTSVTHFWNADNGDASQSTLRGWLHTLGGDVRFSFIVPNAYQKIRGYLSGGVTIGVDLFGYGVQQGPTEIFDENCYEPNVTCWTEETVYSVAGFTYPGLINFYKTGEVRERIHYYRHVKRYETRNGQTRLIGEWIQPWNGPESNRVKYLSQGERDMYVFEILGRMCHLLGDLSVPAHAHIDIHGHPTDAIRHDGYENWMGDVSNYHWNAVRVLQEKGGFINPFVSSNPLHYLMYITQQVADHFNSNGPVNGQGNDNIGGNPLPEEIAFLNMFHLASLGPPTTGDQFSTADFRTIRDHTFPLGIRATAGLL